MSISTSGVDLYYFSHYIAVMDELLLTPGMAAMVEPYLLIKSGASASLERKKGRMATHQRLRVRKALSEAQNHRCACCGVQFSDNPDDVNYATLEHFIPQGFGGTHNRENLAMTCRRCNYERNSSVDDVIAVFG